jgi:hypothetical protein
MRLRITQIALAALLSVFPFACDKPGVTERQNEDKSSEDAMNTTSEGQRQAHVAEGIAEKAIPPARADFETTRENYLRHRRLDLVEVDSKIADLEADSKTATGKTKADLRARLATLHAQRDAFARHLKDLEAAAAATWDGSAANLDKEWEALEKTAGGSG